MLKPESRKHLEDLSKTVYGRALHEYLDEELKILGDIENCTTWDETLGRKHAVKILRKLFQFMEEKAPSTKDPGKYT
jgi:hypothetical protein